MSNHNENPTRKSFKNPPKPDEKIKLFKKGELVTSYSKDGVVTYTEKDSSGVFIDDSVGTAHYTPNTANDLEWEPVEKNTG